MTGSQYQKSRAGWMDEWQEQSDMRARTHTHGRRQKLDYMLQESREENKKRKKKGGGVEQKLGLELLIHFLTQPAARRVMGPQRMSCRLSQCFCCGVFFYPTALLAVVSMLKSASFEMWFKQVSFNMFICSRLISGSVAVLSWVSSIQRGRQGAYQTSETYDSMQIMKSVSLFQQR